MSLPNVFYTAAAGALALHLSTQDVQASVPASYYKIDGKTFTVSGPVRDALAEAAQKTGITYETLVAVCGIETQCDPGKVNKDSKSCGLFQLNPAVETLYQLLHDQGAKYGYREEAGWVERYTRKHDANGNVVYGYRPVSHAAREKVADLCLNPRFNALMYGAYLGPKIRDFNKWLATRKATLGETLLITLLGRYGAKLFIKTAWNGARNNILVVDFFREHKKYFPGAASSNRGFTHNEQGERISVKKAYAQYQNMKLVETAPTTQ